MVTSHHHNFQRMIVLPPFQHGFEHRIRTARARMKKISEHHQALRSQICQQPIKPIEITFRVVRRGNPKSPERCGFSKMRIGQK